MVLLCLQYNLQFSNRLFLLTCISTSAARTGERLGCLAVARACEPAHESLPIVCDDPRRGQGYLGRHGHIPIYEVSANLSACNIAPKDETIQRDYMRARRSCTDGLSRLSTKDARNRYYISPDFWASASNSCKVTSANDTSRISGWLVTHSSLQNTGA